MKFCHINSVCIVILCLVSQYSALDECNKARRMLNNYAILLNPLRDLTGEFRPWRYLVAPNLESGVESDGDKFQISVDVVEYDPTEISVKIVDGFVVVNAKHEEKKDHFGFVSRQLVRRYPLPEGVKSEEVTAQLSTDGILTVSAPKLVTDKGENNRVVTITMTGPTRKEAKEKNEAERSGGEGGTSCSNEDCNQ